MLLIGHRGCRGLLPENSIASFKKAIDIGVDAIELDVVISNDNKVVVSHEPFISKTYCLKPNGNELNYNEDKKYNLFHMTYKEIKEFDSGLKTHPRFPFQIKQKAHKPILVNAIDSCEAYVKNKDKDSIIYIIEIKSNAKYYNTFYPYPKEYVSVILKTISRYDFQNRIILKSFDVNILNEIKLQCPDIQVSLLINTDEDISNKLEELNFKPEFLGPYFKLLTKENVSKYQAIGFKIFAWTVNEINDIKLMETYNIDGLITDYPNRLLK